MDNYNELTCKPESIFSNSSMVITSKHYEVDHVYVGAYELSEGWLKATS